MANTTTLPKEQRQHALRCISKFARLNDAETWDLAFSKTLNILTQILDNPNDDVIFKSYSLRIIRELLIHHTSLFLNYIELTIFRILKAQSETESEVSVHKRKLNIFLSLLFRLLVQLNKQHMQLLNIYLLRALFVYSNQSLNKRNIQ
jgi:hypothetical protein